MPLKSSNKPIINIMYLLSSQSLLKVSSSYTYYLGCSKLNSEHHFSNLSWPRYSFFKKGFLFEILFNIATFLTVTYLSMFTLCPLLIPDNHKIGATT